MLAEMRIRSSDGLGIRYGYFMECLMDFIVRLDGRKDSVLQDTTKMKTVVKNVLSLLGQSLEYK